MNNMSELIVAVKSMTLGPDDYLIVKADQHLSPHQREHIDHKLKETLGDHYSRVIILDGGIDIEILTAEQITKRLEHG
jgi:hypothetical protein